MTEAGGDAAQLEHAGELREASDSFMQRLDRLHELETRKRELPLDAPELVLLARKIEDLARALLFAGGQQVELAEEVHHEAKRSDASITDPIRETPPRRDVLAVLSDWRAAERRLAAAELGSEAATAARLEVERLRDEYRTVTAPTPPRDEA